MVKPLAQALALAVVLATSAAGAAGRSCTEGRFLVDGDALIADRATTRHQAVVLSGGRIAIEGVCAPVGAEAIAWIGDGRRVTMSLDAFAGLTPRAAGAGDETRGTTLRARWRGCTGVAGMLRFQARLASDCSMLSGVVRSRDGRVRRQFRARLSRCGDGVVDAGAGEACDGGACADGTACTEACQCPERPTTTTTAPLATTTTSTRPTASTSTTSTSAPSTTVTSPIPTSTTTSSTTTTEPPSTTTSSTTSETSTTTSSTATTTETPSTTTTSSTTTTTLAHGTVARQWDEEILNAIRKDTPRPTVHARNLFHLSIAMWDAWAAYDGTAAQYLVHERATADDVEAAREVAISYAAYGVLRERYAHSTGATAALASFDARMAALGLDRTFTGTAGDSPAALGNRIAAAVLNFGYTDGANEGPTHTYKDPTGYLPVNAPLVVKLPLITMADPNRWQPLALDFFVTQNGIPEPISVQTFVGPHWGNVAPFALVRSAPGVPYGDLPPPPQLGGEGDAAFRDSVLEVIRYSSLLDPNDGVVIDVSPGVRGNNTLGTDDGTGHPVNPVTGEPYAPNLVKRGDWARLLVEYWADGPESETPPGHWNVIANEVTDALAPEEKRLGGTGPVMSDLEWDVKLYLAVNGAVHDAAIVCWEAKRVYDYVRPISAIRYMASLGQSSDPSLPRYHPDGLPLVPGLIELITEESAALGERHYELRDFRGEGELAIRSWPGQPPIPATMTSGVRWVLARKWITYQRSTFVSPAFAGYTSGHSTFSRAAAEVMTAFTGSPFFPGGLAQVVAAPGFLRHERGPSQTTALQWATYYDAADDAGTSRLYGGIHVAADNYGGRVSGARVGLDAFALATRYYDGSAAP